MHNALARKWKHFQSLAIAFVSIANAKAISSIEGLKGVTRQSSKNLKF